MYSLLKPLLFCLDPERSHHLALKSLQLAQQWGLTRFLTKKVPPHPLTMMGLTFPNPIGLAAGLDKNADYIDALSALQFGFIEIGTVTPKLQSGNPKPRLFRLTKQQAIINRMGFNSKGIEYVKQRLEKTRYRGILGINIGKNRDTPIEKAIDDYVLGFRAFWPFASYITINISSPNTAQLRDLHQRDALAALLSTLKKEQAAVAQTQQKYVPLVVKVSPDLSRQDIHELADVLLQQKIDGIIATNTTTSREYVETSPFAHEAGGLSGKPLQARSTAVIRELHMALQGAIPLIASGGIMDEAAAEEKLNAGASLLQIYTGFIYAGPHLIPRLMRLYSTVTDFAKFRG